MASDSANRMNLNIKVQPRASRNSVEISGDGAVKVRVTAPPDRGRANDAVIKLLAARLRVSRSAVRIVRGHTSRNKVVQVEGLDIADALCRIRASV